MIRTMLARWDRHALSQLAAEVARLADENDALRAALADAELRADQAERWAESWRDDFLGACEAQGARPGITQGGALVLVTAAPLPIA